MTTETTYPSVTDSASVQNPKQIEDPSFYQIALPLEPKAAISLNGHQTYKEKLVRLLTSDLDFRNEDTGFASHDLHSFPAKYPPQLPATFINGLTDSGDLVLDPMIGSGTTIVEAVRLQRKAIGFDIDPLARLITLVKSTFLDPDLVLEAGQEVIKAAQHTIATQGDALTKKLDQRWDKPTQRFVDYWFAPQVQHELLSLIVEIDRIPDDKIRSFLHLVLSACIITKTGGVSMAFDLAHTRPHRAKVVYAQSGKLIVGEDLADSDNARVQFLTKNLKSPISEFARKLKQNVSSIQDLNATWERPTIHEGNAQQLPLADSTVDLIVTSPPYASNAIDYMRAHKFSLVWLGHEINDLSVTRSGYIGGESITSFDFEALPTYTTGVIQGVAAKDSKKGRVLHRYYSEMKRVLEEMYRVLRPGRASIVVVASSIMRGRDTETDRCLAEIGEAIGFEIPAIGVRHIDRNKRMMPAGKKIDLDSQIQQRMHEEYVIGFYKPSE